MSAALYEPDGALADAYLQLTPCAVVEAVVAEGFVAPSAPRCGMANPVA